MWRNLSLLLVAFAMCGSWANPAAADHKNKRGQNAGGLDVVASRGVADSVTNGFFVTADIDGEERPIATAGPFEIFARCFVGATDQIQILVRSAVGGWREPFSTSPFDAGEERVVFDDSANGDQPSYENSVDRFTALGPDENGRLFYLAIDGETLGLGLNVFDHECLAVGTVTLARLGNGGGAAGDDDDDDDRKRRKRRRDDDDDD
jgi:hypothetical protein